MSRPIIAQDLRASDAGCFLDAAAGFSGRLVSVHQAAVGTVIELDNVDQVVYVFRDDIVQMDDYSWDSIYASDADRRRNLDRAVRAQLDHNNLVLLSRAFKPRTES